MKSHPLAPVFAMALLLAILMWLCSSCDKKPQPGYVVCDGKVYVPIEERDSLVLELSEAHKIQMQFDSLLIEYDKARKAFNKAKNWDQQTIAWERQYKILLQEMKLVKKRDSVTRMELENLRYFTAKKNSAIIKIDTSKIKFLNIPPDQRIASLKHAEEGLIHWKTNYIPTNYHFSQNPIGAPHSTYRFNAAEAIYFFHEKEFKAEFYCYVGEEGGKEQRVIIDVTKEQWVKDIFKKFYNAKKE